MGFSAYCSFEVQILWTEMNRGNILVRISEKPQEGQNIGRPLPVDDHATEVWAKLRSAYAVSLFLDFDGTVAPITADPAKARLGSAMRQTLTALAA